MKIQNEHPFTEYTCYKNFHKKMGRWQVCLVSADRTTRKTILYSKFVMSITLGRQLEKHEEVDHIDGDKTNDDITNLEVVTRKENVKRYNLKNPAKTVKLTCPQCAVSFTIKYKNSHLAPYSKKVRNFCSRSCGAKFNKEV